MKKSTLLAFTAAVLFGSGVFHVNAASATYDDPLLLPNPAKVLQQVLLYWFLWLASGCARYP